MAEAPHFPCHPAFEGCRLEVLDTLFRPRTGHLSGFVPIARTISPRGSMERYEATY
jgi:hypothetical protein